MVSIAHTVHILEKGPGWQCVEFDWVTQPCCVAVVTMRPILCTPYCANTQYGARKDPVRTICRYSVLKPSSRIKKRNKIRIKKNPSRLKATRGSSCVNHRNCAEVNRLGKTAPIAGRFDVSIFCRFLSIFPGCSSSYFG